VKVFKIRQIKGWFMNEICKCMRCYMKVTPDKWIVDVDGTRFYLCDECTYKMIRSIMADKEKRKL
jgi:NAD-dependent SIR2 family protein deacetylase